MNNTYNTKKKQNRKAARSLGISLFRQTELDSMTEEDLNYFWNAFPANEIEYLAFADGPKLHNAIILKS